MRRNGSSTDRQNLTVQLRKDVLRRARILAVKRGTSISGLVAESINRLVEEDEAYETSRVRALALLKHGFNLGGKIRVRREEWHER